MTRLSSACASAVYVGVGVYNVYALHRHKTISECTKLNKTSVHTHVERERKREGTKSSTTYRSLFIKRSFLFFFLFFHFDHQAPSSFSFSSSSSSSLWVSCFWLRGFLSRSVYVCNQLGRRRYRKKKKKKKKRIEKKKWWKGGKRLMKQRCLGDAHSPSLWSPLNNHHHRHTGTHTHWGCHCTLLRWSVIRKRSPLPGTDVGPWTHTTKGGGGGGDSDEFYSNTTASQCVCVYSSSSSSSSSSTPSGTHRRVDGWTGG